MKKNAAYMMAAALLCAVTAGVLGFKTSADSNEIVTVKVIQTFNNRWSSAFITYPDGRVDEREMPRLKFIGESNLKESNQTVSKILNEVRGKGYRLISSGGGMAENAMYEVYVFEK